MLKKIPTGELIEKNILIMTQKQGLEFVEKNSGRSPEAMMYEFSDNRPEVSDPGVDDPKKISKNKKEQNKGTIVIVILDSTYLQGELYANILSYAYRQYIRKYSTLRFMTVVPNGKETNTTLSKRKDAAMRSYSDLKVNIYPYHYFTSNILEHISVGEVRILTEQEKQALLEEHCSTPEQYNTDFVDKVIPVWLGAKSGDIIQHSIISRGGIDYNYTRIV